jgi:hypothetical protein
MAARPTMQGGAEPLVAGTLGLGVVRRPFSVARRVDTGEAH